MIWTRSISVWKTETKAVPKWWWAEHHGSDTYSVHPLGADGNASMTGVAVDARRDVYKLPFEVKHWQTLRVYPPADPRYSIFELAFDPAS